MLLIFMGLSRVERLAGVALKPSYGGETSNRRGIVFHEELSPPDIKSF